ncbi:T-cell acute lymphocytic leukemia protein 1-like [Bolinopsis microptera]|uniref:T-cell acute lymphocytic leukemia protein 1-like n=1 Tax=Bolinopsis microptera TaxID=2820187 RepID=UPI003079F55C
MFSEQDSYCGMIDNYQEQTTGYPGYLQGSSELFSRSHSPRTVKRINSNARKRLRQHIVNEAFLKLRDMVPARRPEKKMSKLQILKSATRYINYLTQVLQRDQNINNQTTPSIPPAAQITPSTPPPAQTTPSTPQAANL